MKKSVKKEIRVLIHHFDFKISVKQFQNEKFSILEFEDGWFKISGYRYLSEDFIREFQDKVSWRQISRYQKLSEEFIREFQDKVNWPKVSCYQKLSEDFIREFKHRVYWNNISAYQYLTKEFKEEFLEWWHPVEYERRLKEKLYEEFKQLNNDLPKHSIQWLEV